MIFSSIVLLYFYSWMVFISINVQSSTWLQAFILLSLFHDLTVYNPSIYAERKNFFLIYPFLSIPLYNHVLINGFLIVNLKNNDSLNELNAWIKRITSFCCLLKFYRLFKNNKELKIVTCNNMWLFNKTERKFLAIIVSINALFIRVNYIKMYVNTCAWIIYYEIQLFK